MEFIRGCISAKEELCLIAARICAHYLPDHCLVALGMVSNCQYLQNQALNNSQASSVSPRMSHAREAFYLSITSSPTPLAGAAGSHQVMENTCMVTNIYEIQVCGERAWV